MAYIGRGVEIGAFEKQSLTPDGVTTTFTLTFAVGSANSLLVVYGGVIQEPGVAYSVSGGGQSIVFSEAPVTGTTLYIIYLGKQLTTPRAAGQETTKQTFTGDGTTTLFTLTDPPVVPAGIMVFVDGILQREGSGNNYVSSGSTINFTGAPDSGAEIDVYTLVKEKVSIDTVADGSITRAKLAASHPYWDAAGNVGIGVASPSGLLDMQKDQDGQTLAYLRNTSTGTSARTRMIFSGDASAGNLSIGMHNSNHASYPNQAWIWASGSTTPLVLATQGTARATIDSTGKLGINTQVPKALLHVATSNASDTPTLGTATGGVFVTNANVNYGLHIGSQSTGNSWLQVTRNDSTATAYNLHLQPVGGVVAIGTSTADSLYNLTIQRFSGSSGNIMLQGDNVTIGLPNIVFKNTNGGATAYLGFNGDAVTAKAIAFPATQVASSDPNTLDDYEEGTWTPAIIGTITNPVYSTSNITAKYTKIGRIVHFQFLIVVNGVTSQGSGNIQISGLPFGSTGNSYEHVVQIGYNDVWDTNFISGYVSGSYIVVIPATVTQSNAVWGAASATSSNLSTGYFAISGTYVTTT